MYSIIGHTTTRAYCDCCRRPLTKSVVISNGRITMYVGVVCAQKYVSSVRAVATCDIDLDAQALSYARRDSRYTPANEKLLCREWLKKLVLEKNKQLKLF